MLAASPTPSRYRNSFQFNTSIARHATYAGLRRGFVNRVPGAPRRM